MVPWDYVGQRGGTPHHGEGKEWLVLGARVVDPSRRIRALRSSQRSRVPRYDTETGELLRNG